MTTTRTVLLGALLGLLITLGYACGTGPTPVPDPPVPPEPADQRFAGFHDCTDLDTAPVDCWQTAGRAPNGFDWQQLVADAEARSAA